MCNLQPGYFKSKDFEIYGQKYIFYYSIAGFYTVEYPLHMNEAVKSWPPKSIWIPTPIS